MTPVRLFVARPTFLACAVVCLLGPILPAHASKNAPTFAEDIAPLVYQNCVSCHRPGQAGPFSFLTYNDVAKRAATMQDVINERYMPPWKPAAGHVTFKDERRLTDDQIALFNRWVKAGKPQGDPAKAPKPPVFKSDWALGKPDLVLKMKQGYNVPAEGRDIYRWFVLPMDLPEDKWIKAVEFRPSARSVVHHSLFFLDDTGEARRLDGKDGKPGFKGMRARISGRLGGYVPGNTPAFLPEDLALPMPKGSDLVLQTHFHPTGKAETEQSEIAFWFADKEPSRKLVNIQVPPGFGSGAGIDIPAGENDFRIEDTIRIPVDVVAWQIGGHAHYICKSMKMTATFPDGTTKPLLAINDWDLDWQDDYQFSKPLRLPAGTVIKTELAYDNSAANLDNPHSPPKRVRWGKESTDEMGSMTLVVTAAHQSDHRRLENAVKLNNAKAVRGARKLVAKVIAERTMEKLDKNGDGKLEKHEVPIRYRGNVFTRLDTNNDGKVDLKELENLEALRQ